MCAIDCVSKQNALKEATVLNDEIQNVGMSLRLCAARSNSNDRQSEAIPRRIDRQTNLYACCRAARPGRERSHHVPHFMQGGQRSCRARAVLGASGLRAHIGPLGGIVNTSTRPETSMGKNEGERTHNRVLAAALRCQSLLSRV